MKKIGLLSILLPVLMLLIPLPSMKNAPNESIAVSGSYTYSDDTTVPANEAASESFRLYDHESGEIIEISTEDYIFGVLAAEMPASYEPEALKAQAVAAYTFACRRKQTAENKEYDISTDYTVDQAYITTAAAQEKWGENADVYTEKLKTAVSEVSGYLVTYNGDTALTVYHAVSSGKTENAEDIWGSEIPYLTAVDSSGDRLASNYLSSAEFTAEEFSDKLTALCEFTGEPETWLGKSECTDSGHVKQITICRKAISGSDVRSALELPSSTFDISFSDGGFIVNCRGYGHGVGMSQHGANILAQQGSDFKEILSHYYPGCEIEKVN